jgi:IMP dehydrogenase/GMP reductase
MEQITAETYEYDDVLVYPVPSSVSSRDDVDISVKLSDKLTLKFPLIASPMVGVVDGAFAYQLSQLGGLAILHRFYKDKKALDYDVSQNLNSLNGDKFGMSVKIGDPDFKEYLDKYNPNIILVDTANGYIESLLRYCSEIKNHITFNNLDILLMAGNVADRLGCQNLYDAGCDITRVGIGGGSLCSTRNITGIGIPTVTSLMDCDAPDKKYKIIADGGIRNSGDFVKSIVAGANLGMSGRLYAECYESPNEGTLYGMASRTHMENMKTEIKSVEGFDTPIKKKHSLAQFVKEFGYGIKSAGTYLNARSLNEIYMNGKFIKVSHSAIKKGI